MLSNTMLKCKGMEILSEHLGIVEAARFIALINRDKFDYTEWQSDLFGDMPLDEFLAAADKYQKEQYG